MRGFLKRNRESIKYLMISYLGVIGNMILNIILMSKLETISFGKVSLGKSILQSFEYSHLGSRFALDRLLPVTDEQNKKEVYFSISLFITLIVSALLSIFWMFYDPENWSFFIFFVISGILYSGLSVYRVYYRSFDNKKIFIQVSFWIILVPILFQIIGVFFWNDIGVIWGVLIAFLLSTLVCGYFYKVRIFFNIRHSFMEFKELFAKGGLLFVSALISFFTLLGDRFFINYKLGFEVLGKYSVIMFFFAAFNVLGQSYSELVMNKVMVEPTKRLLRKHVLVVLALNVGFFIVAYSLLPLFINLLVPKYNDLLEDIRLILFGGVIYSTLPLLNSFLHARDKRIILLFLNIFSTVIYFVCLTFVLGSYSRIEDLVYVKLGVILLISFSTGIVAFLLRKD